MGKDRELKLGIKLDLQRLEDKKYINNRQFYNAFSANQIGETVFSKFKSYTSVSTKLRADKFTIEAQVYARSLYEKNGFRQLSEEFLEDVIPHIQMQLEL